MPVYVGLLSLLLLAGCASNAETQAPAPVPLEQQISELRGKLLALTRNTQCETSSQCRVQPIGHRPCGGPSTFLVYSTLHTPEEELKSASKELTDLERRYNQERHLISTCQVLPTPVGQCSHNQCILISGPKADVR